MPEPGTGRRILANLLRLTGGKAAGGLISLVYMVLAARALGARDYGVLVLVHGFAMTVGGIVEFPGWHAIVRYGAEARAAADVGRLRRLIRFAGLVEGAGGLCAVLVAALIGPLLGARLGWSPPAVALAVPYSLAVLASIRATPAGYLQLVGRFDLLGLHAAIAPALRLAGSLAAVAAGAGLRGFLIAWLAAALGEWASMWLLGWWVARRELGRGARGAGSVRAENPGIWRFMVAANADVTLSELSGRLVPLVVGATMGPAAAGLLAVAQRATVVIAQPAQLLGQAAYAELARLVADGGDGRALRRAVLACVGSAAAAAAPVVALLALFGREVAVLIGGAAFTGAAPLMPWLAAARGLLLAGPPVSAALTAIGRPALSVTANLLASLGFLPLLPLLLRLGGLPGAGWHALVQAAATALLLSGLLWRATAEAPSRLAAAH